MAEDRNDQSRFGGQYMVQDRDHMSDISEVSNKPGRTGVRQADQTQTGARQQGGDDQVAGPQQGGRRRQVQ